MNLNQKVDRILALLEKTDSADPSIVALADIDQIKSVNHLVGVLNTIKTSSNADIIDKCISFLSTIDDSKDGLIALLNSDEWPKAIPDQNICKDIESDKIERAIGIVNYVEDNLTEKSFLDFGCGEGHVVKQSNALRAVGYDIVKSGTLEWEGEISNGGLLTNDFNKVKENGPYDIILLYDVLDHVENPEAILNSIREVSNFETKIYVRCHPWCSRHGGHLYNQMNKAFIHMIFNTKELKELGLETSVRKIYFPHKTQKQWFANTKFKIITEDTVTQPVESFFEKPIIAKRLADGPYSEFPRPQIQMIFNDYLIKKST